MPWVQHFPGCMLALLSPLSCCFQLIPPALVVQSNISWLVGPWVGLSCFHAGTVKSRSTPAVSDSICSLPVAQFHVCSEQLTQHFFTMLPLEHMWRVCRNGCHCVYSAWGFLRCLSEGSAHRISPSPSHISAMTEDCSLQARTGAGPPGRRRKPSGDVRAARIYPCHAKKTLLGVQARKYKISENRLCVCASSGGAFRTPNRGVDSHAHPVSHPRTRAQESLIYILNNCG